MEVTKDEQRKLDDLFRKIADRDEFVAQQRQAAETLRRKEAEPPVTVWVVVDRYTLRDWGQEGFGICGVYLTLDEAVAAIHAERDRHTSEGLLQPIGGNGENTRWHYNEWDAVHNYGIEQAPILSTFKTEGQPLPEDSVIFQKGVAEGRRLEREDMEKKPKFYPGDVIKCTSTGSLWVRCKGGDNRRSDGHTACIGGGFELASEEEAVQFFQELNENGYQWDHIKGRPMKKEQKSELNEEDEIYLQDALWCVKQASKIARGENDIGACWSAERWLKSLKNRGNFLKSNTNSSTKEGQR